MKRRRKLLVVIGLLFVFLTWCGNGMFVSAQEPAAYDELNLYAKAAVLMDAKTGRVLYGKNTQEQMPMASTTKIMTCIVALENGNPEDYVEVSSYAAGMPKVKLFMQTGEHYRLKDLLYSLMLESHNDSAVAIAEHVGGSVEAFAGLMNQKARDLGCYNTYFITPNGLDAVITETGKAHSTTAEDLAKIMAYCVGKSEKREEFLEITRTPSYSFGNYIKEKDTDAMKQGGRSFSCNNHNAFLNMMDGALSGKTGFTSKAGYCYVGALERDGKLFTVALLACGWPNHKTYKWSDTQKLMNYGLENYDYQEVFRKMEFEEIPVEEGIAPGQGATPYDKASVPVSMETAGEESLSLLLCADDKIEIKQSLQQKLEAPVAAGTDVGAVDYYLNGELVKSYRVLTAAEVSRVSLTWIMQYVTGLYFL